MGAPEQSGDNTSSLMVRTRHERFGLEHLEPRQFLAAISWDGGGGDTSLRHRHRQ